MKNYYSIIFASIRPEIEEKISIGLLFWNETKKYFEYSNKKLSLSGNLFSDNSYILLKDSLTNIEHTIDLKDKSLDKDYIDYLSKYNQNVLKWTSPKIIDLDVNKDNFKKLFSKLIDNSTVNNICRFSSVFCRI